MAITGQAGYCFIHQDGSFNRCRRYPAYRAQHDAACSGIDLVYRRARAEPAPDRGAGDAGAQGRRRAGRPVTCCPTATCARSSCSASWVSGRCSICARPTGAGPPWLERKPECRRTRSLLLPGWGRGSRSRADMGGCSGWRQSHFEFHDLLSTRMRQP